jgi:hypothetical protein
VKGKKKPIYVFMTAVSAPEGRDMSSAHEDISPFDSVGSDIVPQVKDDTSQPFAFAC